MSEEINTAPVDARGVPITPGATVIYGAPVDRSIAMVEATVADPMLTPSGRIWLNIVRRGFGGGYGDMKDRVHVGADRLTVVLALPPSKRLTEREIVDRRDEQIARRTAHLDAYHAANGHTMAIRPGNGWEYCAQDCWDESRRWDKLWEAGEIT